ncbi:MAG: flagellar protein FlgN [Proteobacteria bacterium]|nr:flagellar protein FlgN [Pseudomonadota bacterium]MBU1737192.1 flagellar protein FlgN [Pseudomonadota bacterium]
MEKLHEAKPGVVAALFASLEKEIALCEELVTVLDIEKAALIAMNMQELIRLSGLKQNLAERISRQDEYLRETIVRLVEDSDGRVYKLSALEPVIADDEAASLRRYREKLSSLRFKIEDRNLVNRRFAEETMKYIGDAISMITGAIAEHTAYQSRGNHSPSTPRPALISREV